MKNIILIGFMGSGKTSVGKEISSITGMKLEDIDLSIVKGAKMEIKDIFSGYGEDHFRKLETKAVKKVLSLTNRVISTGGGIVTVPGNLEILKRGGTVVYLKNSFAVSSKRLAGRKDRPLFDRGNLKKTELLFRKRLKLYENAANITVVTDTKTVLQAAKEVIKKAGIKLEKNKVKTEK